MAIIIIEARRTLTLDIVIFFRTQRQGPYTNHNGSENVAKQRVHEWCNGSARVTNLRTFLSQPMQNKQVHHRAYCSFWN